MTTIINTEARAQTLPPWKLSDVFTPATLPHHCCDCCNGYCPEIDLPTLQFERPARLFIVSRRWISDRYVAIDSSMIEPPGDLEIDGNVEKHTLGDSAAWTGVESAAQFTGQVAARLLNLGIFIQEEPGTTKTGNRAPQSLWYSQDSAEPIHIGWIMPARQAGPGDQYIPPTLDTVRRYQRILSTWNEHPYLQGLVELISLEPFRALDALESVFGVDALDGAA